MLLDLQKASMWKRISAFLFDAIILSILAVLVAFALSAALGYDRYETQYTQAYNRYTEQFGITAEMRARAADGTQTPEDTELLNAASKALSEDPVASHAFSMVISLSVLIVTFGLLLAFLVLEVIVPGVLGNGQTLGKRIFGVGVMLVDGVKISTLALFVRTVLGKFAVETMPLVMCVLYLFTGLGSPVFLLLGVALLIANGLVLLFSHENAMLHDKMAATVTVDLASQMIFDTREALLAYKQKLHAEKAAAASY